MLLFQYTVGVVQQLVQVGIHSLQIDCSSYLTEQLLKNLIFPDTDRMIGLLDVLSMADMRSWKPCLCYQRYDNSIFAVVVVTQLLNVTVLFCTYFHQNGLQWFLVHTHCSQGSVVMTVLKLQLQMTPQRKYSHLSSTIFGLEVA